MPSAIRYLLSAIVRLDWLCVLAANALFVSAKTYHPYMWAGVALVALPFVARWIGEGRPARRTPLDLPLGLFLLSALLGLWPSYDLTLSWPLFFRLLGGVALFYLLVNHSRSERFAWAFAAGLVSLGLAAAIYFITQYRAADYPDKFEVIGRIGDTISQFFPKLFTFYAHPNVVAGLLEIVLPLALALSLGPMFTRRLELLPHQVATEAHRRTQNGDLRAGSGNSSVDFCVFPWLNPRSDQQPIGYQQPIGHQPSAISHQPSAIRNPQPTIRNPQSAIRNLIWAAYRLIPFFFLAAALVIAYALLLTSSR
ncbi:MAG: hypothetical protein FJW34_18775, partial [Acidobacteria bacterium]|nr:hypothetical protein [Acidobacteriota bacterium]